MVYRNLGNTGLKVSEIGMGCEGFAEENYGMTQKFFDYAEEAGINYFDLYSPDPKMRAAIGDAMQGRRKKFVIQSHICSVWENDQYLRTRDLAKVKVGFEESLQLLQTDYIDVGMIHYCDAAADWQEIIDNGILDYAVELKEQGKIGHIGLSSHNPTVALEAIRTGKIEVLMFSVNPCYDLVPANEDVNVFWEEDTFKQNYTNMDPDREALYEACQSMGVGITVMKAFAGGELLNAETSPAGVALTVNQCIHYCLTRPAVSVVLAGAKNLEELKTSVAYEEAAEEDKDYAGAFANFPKIRWEGHCMYCSHCAPCPKRISVADVTKFLHLAEAGMRSGGVIPETVREHYAALEAHAGDCVRCGACETRCPFGVAIRDNMKKAASIFGY